MPIDTTLYAGECIQEDCYEGQVSGNFIIRWAFQKACDFVFDPRTDIWRWPSDSKKGVTFDPSKVQPGSIIFVRDVPLFFKKMNPQIQHPYIMVTHGESLDKMCEKCNKYLEEEKLIAWFGIHPSKKVVHPKYHPLPIGVLQQPANYKDRVKLNSFFARLRTVEKKYLVYSNFAAQEDKPERKKVKSLFNHQSYCKRGQRQPFHDYMKEMAQCKFTLSPKGIAIDCYRTWESLLVGSIPIVRTCQLDPIYEGLPVLIVQNWEDINEQFLNEKYKEIMSKKYDPSKLYMEYWIAQIKAVRDEFLANYKGTVQQPKQEAAS